MGVGDQCGWYGRRVTGCRIAPNHFGRGEDSESFCDDVCCTIARGASENLRAGLAVEYLSYCLDHRDRLASSRALGLSS